MSTQTPSDEEVLDVVRRRGCVSLRGVCLEFWPQLRWRPLMPGEDSVAEGSVSFGTTRAITVWAALGRLLAREQLRLSGRDPDEVDALAAATFEIVGHYHRSCN